MYIWREFECRNHAVHIVGNCVKAYILVRGKMVAVGIGFIYEEGEKSS